MMMVENWRCQAGDWEPTGPKSMTLLRMPSTTLFGIIWYSLSVRTLWHVHRHPFQPVKLSHTNHWPRNETAECTHTDLYSIVHFSTCSKIYRKWVLARDKAGLRVRRRIFVILSGMRARRQVQRKTGRYSSTVVSSSCGDQTLGGRGFNDG